MTAPTPRGRRPDHRIPPPRNTGGRFRYDANDRPVLTRRFRYDHDESRPNRFRYDGDRQKPIQ